MNFQVVDDEGEPQALSAQELDALSQLTDVADEEATVLGRTVSVPNEVEGHILSCCDDVKCALQRIRPATPEQANAKARGIVLVEELINIESAIPEPVASDGGRGRGRGKRGLGRGRGRGALDVYARTGPLAPFTRAE